MVTPSSGCSPAPKAVESNALEMLMEELHGARLSSGTIESAADKLIRRRAA